jgi:hypothetical protein
VVIQTKLQTPEYWESGFSLSDADLEQIYNYLLDKETPQTAAELARVVIDSRIKQEVAEFKRLLANHTIYQPQRSYQVGEEVVFPAMKMAQGTVREIRKGYNPESGSFSVIRVDIKGKIREFAADYKTSHTLNANNGESLADDVANNADLIRTSHISTVTSRIEDSLRAREDFIKVDDHWFVKSLLVDVNIGHLHLTEAILEMADGGPLTTNEILPQLELDPAASADAQTFSLTYHLHQDDRFDQVSPAGKPVWFLGRMEPEAVRTTPERLVYQPLAYNRSVLTPQQIALEQELDDEWSDLPALAPTPPIILALAYPHRWAGTLPINAKTRGLFDLKRSPRQRVTLIDDQTNETIAGWVVGEGRYVYGLADWYKENSIPVGGFLHLQAGPEPGTILIGYDRRRPQREWVRLATMKDNRINFELQRRAIPCGYDDLLIVGTDAVTAIDTHARRVTANRMPLATLLAEVFPSLAGLSPQNTVHAKTLYSAINMLRRLPPGPIFAELTQQPAFIPVGDHYWQYGGAVGTNQE